MQSHKKNDIRRPSLLALLTLVLLSLNLAPALAAGPLCYVHAGATGANTGTSWADAYTELQAALAGAGCAEIWVAAGTHYPTTGTDRTATFQLKNGLAIYGGFNGTETARDQRNPDPATNNTLLSGDIGAPAGNGDNSYHVVTGSGTDNTAVLDGFTVTAGQTDGSAPDNRGAGMYNNGGSPTLTNLIVSNNRTQGNGAGMVNVNNSSPVLTNVSFNNNHISTGHNGGGMFNAAGSNPVLANVLFSNNKARAGGGMFNNGVSPRLTNATFSGNTAIEEGGGMFNANGSNPILTNVTFSGNSAFFGGGMMNRVSSPTLINVIIANSSGGDCESLEDSLNPTSANNLIEDAATACGLTDGVNGNIIGLDPNLGPLADNGGATPTHALLEGSPAINAGDDTSCPAADQRGVARPQGAHCDIGAFEVDATPPVITPHVSGALGNNGWYTGDVSISWSVSDESTISSTGGCEPTTLTSDTAGITFTCEAASEGGSSSASLTIQRDATPPVVSITGVTDGANYEEGAVPTAGCETQAGLAGIATLASLSLSGGNGSRLGTFTATCEGATDNAGNTAAPVSASYSVTASGATIFLPLIQKAGGQ